MSVLRYKYYDTPEGQDIYKKTICLSKYAAVTGFAIATHDVLMYSHPKGPLRTVGRFMYYIGPLVGMATAFTLTANVTQNIRGKNDRFNYFLGGAAAGSIFSAWTKSGVIAAPMCCILGALGIILKSAHDEGWTLFPEFPRATKTIMSVRHDWTLAKDIPELQNWTTGKEQ